MFLKLCHIHLITPGQTHSQQTEHISLDPLLERSTWCSGLICVNAHSRCLKLVGGYDHVS